MRDAFYKYLSSESLKITLSSTSRKWSSPFEFNDPFDNYIDIQWMESLRDFESKIRNKIYDLTEDENFDLSTLSPKLHCIVHILRQLKPKDRDGILEKITAEAYSQQQLDNTFAMWNEKLRRVLSDCSIFCVTEEYDNLLMWAHYAENHKGGVIKFLPIKEVDSPLLVAKKVGYCLAVPSLEITDIIENKMENRLKIIDVITLTKGRDWAYEKEWRVVSGLRNPSKKFEIIPFAEEEVGALYLGCRITEADKAEIMDIMNQKYPWAPVYLAEPKRNEFSLGFTRIK